MTAAYLVSVHARYAGPILDGTKRIELRRRFSRAAAGARMLIYETRPTAAVVGRAEIERLEELPLAELWSRHGADAAIDRAAFDRYFTGLHVGVGLVLSRPLRFRNPVALSELRTRYGLEAPQSYAILRADHCGLTGHESN